MKKILMLLFTFTSLSAFANCEVSCENTKGSIGNQTKAALNNVVFFIDDCQYESWSKKCTINNSIGEFYYSNKIGGYTLLPHVYLGERAVDQMLKLDNSKTAKIKNQNAMIQTQLDACNNNLELQN